MAPKAFNFLGFGAKCHFQSHTPHHIMQVSFGQNAVTPHHVMQVSFLYYRVHDRILAEFGR